VVRDVPVRVAVATFSTKTDLVALDLTGLPEPASVFDEGRSDERETVLFLNGFVDAITQRVAKDGREHVDYVPSQVVSEYFAQMFKTEAGRELNAVIYPSAAHEGGTNLVMFPPRSFTPKLTDQIEMVRVEQREIKNGAAAARFRAG
jgi:hypothetical protein